MVAGGEAKAIAEALAGIAGGETGVGDVPFVEAQADADAGIRAVLPDEGDEGLVGLAAR